MSRLTTKERNALPASDFAGPDRTYPIEDASHARNAKSRVSEYGSPKLKKRIKAKVKKKFPKIGDGKEARIKKSVELL